MQRIRITYVLILLTFITGTSTASAGSFYNPGMPTRGAENSSTIKIQQNSIVLAEEEEDPSEKESKPKAGEENRASTAGGKTVENSKNSSNEKTKSIKPFVPSEKIAAEQAVDFPSDI